MSVLLSPSKSDTAVEWGCADAIAAQASTIATQIEQRCPERDRRQVQVAANGRPPVTVWTTSLITNDASATEPRRKFRRPFPRSSSASALKLSRRSDASVLLSGEAVFRAVK